MDFVGCMRVSPCELGLEAARRLEWLLPNGLGGYASSTVLGLNTRKYHGLLVSSRGNLERRVLLEALLEEVSVGGDMCCISVSEYADALDSRGLQYLKGFVNGVTHVVFEYDVKGVRLVKRVQAVPGLNAVTVFYGVRNGSGSNVTLRVRPLVNSRGIHELNPMGRDFKTEVRGGVLAVECASDSMLFSGEAMTPSADGCWYRNLRYSAEAERGENSVEDAFSPGVLTMSVGAYVSGEGRVAVASAGSLDEAGGMLGKVGDLKPVSHEPDPLSVLAATGRSFIVDVGGVKTVVAGYHWFEDWGRDAMVSLPGLTLVDRRFDEAEVVFARFIDGMRDGRIPTRFTADGPIYYDFDGTLWMIDRLKEYVRYAGLERALRFISPRWQRIRGVVDVYSRWVENGLLKHKSGTWMDALPRDNAVEVQGLWYNALNVVEGLSILVGDPVDYSGLKADFESGFMDKYWNGNYLDDCLGDSALRPNQVLAAALDYSVISDREASELMEVVEEELLTPCGLRTLDRKNPKYCSRYVGGVEERAKAYHNGTVWPWLLGAYAKAAVKLGGEAGRRHAREVLEPLFNRLCDNCMGSINEIYDADEPHTPRGAVSQAWSVAEILRAYGEDVLGGRP